MDFFTEVQNRHKNIRLSSLLNFSPLSKDEKNHLMKVYGLLSMGTVVTAMSCYLDILYFRFPRFLASIISLVSMVALAWTSGSSQLRSESASKRRLSYFVALSGCLGVLMSDYINYVNYLNPSILPLAFFGSLSIFICFSLAAIFSKNRLSLFLGTILGAVCSYMTLLSFMNIFIQSKFIDTSLLYIGFFMYMGFVLFDTQLTLFDFRRGNKDYIMHSLCLYLDLVGLFTHLLRILGKQEEEEDRKR